MKKILLVAAVAVSSIAANAQMLEPKSEMQMVKMQNLSIASVEAEKPLKASEATLAGPKRMLADDCFYSIPDGSMVYGLTKEGAGYYNAYLVFPPYTDIVLKNRCSEPAAAVWKYGEEELTDMATETNDLDFGSIRGAAGYYLPAITRGTTTYTWATTDNRYSASQGREFKSAVRAFDEPAPCRASDPHIGPDYIGWGYIDSHFLFGDGKLVDQDDEGNDRNLQTFGVSQKYKKPVSPMYVEDIYVEVLTLDKEDGFLAEGQLLTMEIRNAEGLTLYELTCEASDIIPDEAENTTDYGVMRYGTAVFTLKEIDELSGDLATVPFVLDEAFTVIIRGIDGTGIGFPGHAATDEEALYIERGNNLFYNVENPEDMVSYTFQNHISVPLTFTAFFDNVNIWTEARLNDGTVLEHFNVLQVAADGTTVTNMGYPAANYTQFNTASSWYDENESENYYLADKDEEFVEWLGYGVDNTSWTDYDPETENPGDDVMLTVECEPLPEGVTGRYAILYVYGRGIVSEDPIIVLQGDITLEQALEADGVKAVKAANTAKAYNLMGQQVSANAKGLVIRNGKKTVSK